VRLTKIGLLAVVAAIGASAAATASPNETTQYRFRDVRVQNVRQLDGQPHAEVEYATEWSGTFPGWRTCTIETRDRDGAISGTRTYNLVDLSPGASTTTTMVPLDTDPAAVSASVRCGSARLDDESGYYEFSAVRFERNHEVSADFRSFDAIFDTSWVGGGLIPGVQACTLVAHDQQGRSLFEYPFTFSDGQRGGEDKTMLVLLDQPQPVDPASGTITCRHL